VAGAVSGCGGGAAAAAAGSAGGWLLQARAATATGCPPGRAPELARRGPDSLGAASAAQGRKRDGALAWPHLVARDVGDHVGVVARLLQLLLYERGVLQLPVLPELLQHRAPPQRVARHRRDVLVHGAQNVPQHLLGAHDHARRARGQAAWQRGARRGAMARVRRGAGLAGFVRSPLQLWHLCAAGSAVRAAGLPRPAQACPEKLAKRGRAAETQAATTLHTRQLSSAVAVQPAPNVAIAAQKHTTSSSYCP
jgi:hypothetical protein